MFDCRALYPRLPALVRQRLSPSHSQEAGRRQVLREVEKIKTDKLEHKKSCGVHISSKELLFLKDRQYRTFHSISALRIFTATSLCNNADIASGPGRDYMRRRAYRYVTNRLHICASFYPESPEDFRDIRVAGSPESGPTASAHPLCQISQLFYLLWIPVEGCFPDRFSA